LLKNRVYVGELVHKDKYFPGEHEAIVDRGLFDSVQGSLRSNAHQRRQDRINTGSLLSGRIYDDRGNRMTPTSAKRGGARYRYYVSCALFQGRQDEVGSVARVPAPEVEALVLQTLSDATADPTSPVSDAMLDCELVGRILEKIVVRKGSVEIAYRGSDNIQIHSLSVPLSLPPTRVRREISSPDGSSVHEARPIRSETRARLIEGIAKARLWIDELVTGRVTNTAEIARHEGCSERSVRMTLGLAFLSPGITKAAVDGSLPHGIGITKLVTAPANWQTQLCPR
jgi:hypothetical protein